MQPLTAFQPVIVPAGYHPEAPKHYAAVRIGNKLDRLIYKFYPRALLKSPVCAQRLKFSDKESTPPLLIS